MMAGYPDWLPQRRHRREDDGQAAGAIALTVLIALAAAAGATPAPVSPEQAIVRAVAQRLGVPARIDVVDLDTTVIAEPGLVATPHPAARLARPARFVLTVNDVRRGVATATVIAVAPVPRAARAIGRDETIGADDVEVTSDALPDVLLRPLLDAGGVMGLTTRRAVVPGEVLSASVLWVPPVVRTGDEVEAVVRIGTVEVKGQGVASGSGRVGDVIRIMQPQSSRLLRARVTGPGAVEIVE